MNLYIKQKLRTNLLPSNAYILNICRFGHGGFFFFHCTFMKKVIYNFIFPFFFFISIILYFLDLLIRCFVFFSFFILWPKNPHPSLPHCLAYPKTYVHLLHKAPLFATLLYPTPSWLSLLHSLVHSIYKLSSFGFIVKKKNAYHCKAIIFEKPLCRLSWVFIDF